MHLKEITYNGFKSFGDRTHLKLEPGMTAIVGPNGCGKSNIADGIRWVLGEQSAKALRGNKMQDVIFEGTDKRKPHNLCEVTLVFTDCEEQLGTEFNEVEITRRVFRDGGSEYRLNGKVCRLKDIQRLFMDTGVGQSSYSFMAQGQITQIIDSNPAERRHLFEEAAGITRYKAQRKETLNKLTLVEQNLSRVTDIIQEVERQIGSLQRQASKALRYQRIKHRLTHLDLALQGFRYDKLVKEIQEKALTLNNLEKELRGLQDSLEEEESSLERNKSDRSQRTQDLQTQQQNIFELRSQKGDAVNQIELAQSRVQDLGKRIEEIDGELAQLSEERNQLDEKLRDSNEVKQSQMEMVGSSDDILREKTDALNAVQEQYVSLERQIRETRQQQLVTEGSMTRLRANCTTFEVDLKSYEVKHAGLTENVARFREIVETRQIRLNETQTVLSERLGDRESSDSKEQEIKEKEKSLTADFRNKQIEIQDTDRELAKITAQKNILQDLQEKFEGFGEGARNILSGKLEHILAENDFQILTREIQVDPAHRSSLETLLGEALDTILVSDANKAFSVSQELTDQLLGRAVMQIPVPADSSASSSTEAPDFLTPARIAATAESPEIKAFLDHLLRDSYFTNDMQAFMSFWQSNPSFSFMWVADQNGCVLDCRGLLEGGKDKGENNSFLQRAQQIGELDEQIKTFQQALETKRNEQQGIQQAIDRTHGELENHRQRQAEIAEEISTLKAEQRGFENEIQQAERDLDKSEAELIRFEETRVETENRLHQAQSELQAAEAKINEFKEITEQTEQQMASANQEREIAREALANVRLELAEKKQKLEFLDRNLQEVEQRSREIAQRTERRTMEREQAEVQINELRATTDEFDSRSKELDATIAIANETLEQKRVELLELEKGIKEQEEQLHGRLDRRRELDQQVNNLQMNLTKQRSQVEFLIEKAQSDYDILLEQVDWKTRLWKADEKFEQKVKLDELEDSDEISLQSKDRRGDPTKEELEAMEQTDWKPIEEEVQQLRQRINSMGPVNLSAIEEYADLKERYDFLKGQSEDLWNSKNELLEAIDEINETSKTLFADTFEQIRKNFRHTFDSLFAGGEADLRLLDEGDILDSGIEIVARPPGTRLKSLTLLSGGQKTMTAVGLLFAIYMVKPSPFCVLDELDAPLDDANVGRFTNMLKQFLKMSQFLVITHNKRTISAANSIFGATMQEKGVTNILSLRFEQIGDDAESIIGEDIV